MNTSYDSRDDTTEHIRKVRGFLEVAIDNLYERSYAHDESKLDEPEKSAWDIATPKLTEFEYGSDGYRQTLRDIRPAVQHHYEVNDHHPEHFENGVAGMSLMGLIEMLCDWKAATERSPGGNLADSFDHNKERWGYSDELDSILRSTAKELGLI